MKNILKYYLVVISLLYCNHSFASVSSKKKNQPRPTSVDSKMKQHLAKLHSFVMLGLTKDMEHLLVKSYFNVYEQNVRKVNNGLLPLPLITKTKIIDYILSEKLAKKEAGSLLEAFVKKERIYRPSACFIARAVLEKYNQTAQLSEPSQTLQPETSLKRHRAEHQR